jgi:hypothetical protein
MVLFVYVDNSNVWIEGMRINAVKKGLASTVQDAMDRKVVDQSWTYDFGALYREVCPDGEKIGRSSLFGSRPPANDSLWEMARSEGFEVFTFDRNFKNKEKEVDVAISVQIVEDSFQHMKPERGDRVVLVSGDRDYAPVVESLSRRSIHTSVVFWEHATAVHLREVVDRFEPLDDVFERISRRRGAV